MNDNRTANRAADQLSRAKINDRRYKMK